MDDGHFGSVEERGTHIGKPLNAVAVLASLAKFCGDTWHTCHTRVDIVCSKFWLRCVASGEDSIRIVDANDLTSLQGNLAITVQRLDHAAVGFKRELGDLNLAGNGDTINIIAGNLETIRSVLLYLDQMNIQ